LYGFVEGKGLLLSLHSPDRAAASASAVDENPGSVTEYCASAVVVDVDHGALAQPDA
jgi:hypothetical protein